MGKHHDDLSIVTCGHDRGTRGAARLGGNEATTKKLFWCHGKEDVLMVAMPDEEH